MYSSPQQVTSPGSETVQITRPDGPASCKSVASGLKLRLMQSLRRHKQGYNTDLPYYPVLAARRGQSERAATSTPQQVCTAISDTGDQRMSMLLTALN